jgi:hypothetical protein
MEILKKNTIMKTISIYLKGGLGNQLFQIAFLFSLSQKTQHKMILTENVIGPRQRLYFNNIFCNFSKFIDTKYNSKNAKLIMEHKEFHYTTYEENKIYQNKNEICFNGYFQNTKYFVDYLQSLKEFINYKTLLEINNIQYQYNTIALHLRFGDYLKFNKVYVKLSSNYYINAIKTLEQHRVINSIIIFHENNTEDSKLIEEYVDEIKSKYPNMNVKDVYIDYGINDDWKQLLLISQCENIIIANSTFSLWGAYFNGHANVCYPSEFFCDKRNVSGLFLKGWYIVEQ